MRRTLLLLLGLGFLLVTAAFAQSPSGRSTVDQRVDRIEPQVIDWRRDIHAHPELANREERTAAMVATHLRSLDMEVRTGVAKTGVVGVLDGAEAGPVVALRADMDALPVKERTDVPFASTDSAVFNGTRVPVMHACGHDAHVAMLMGAAEVLASMRDTLSGTVKFLFQPAEEGAPAGERGGADVMIEEGVLEQPEVDAVFGLHIRSKTEVGTIRYAPGPVMAASDVFRIEVEGKQTHASTPWEGVDPIVTGAEIVTTVQTVVSRQANLADEAAVVSVGTFDAGVRNNIIPQTAELTGTIRTLDPQMRTRIHERIRRVASATAKAMGASVDVDINRGYPATKNDPSLMRELKPALRRSADSLVAMDPIMGAEDFSYYGREVPAVYVFVGGRRPGMERAAAPSHHTPEFFIDESGLRYGVRAYVNVALRYLDQHASEAQDGVEVEDR